jgi:hypothetical protein
MKERSIGVLGLFQTGTWIGNLERKYLGPKNLIKLSELMFTDGLSNILHLGISSTRWKMFPEKSLTGSGEAGL